MKEKAAVALVALGFVQMTGDVVGSAVMRGIGMATAAAPAPRVFTTMGDFEPFSTRFFLEWRDRGGRTQSVELTPDVYTRLQGAYNRRNAIGATLAAGPVLIADPRTREMTQDIVRHALCGEASVLQELGLDRATMRSAPSVRYAIRPGAASTGTTVTVSPDCGTGS